jgi:hypothetical protein
VFCDTICRGIDYRDVGEDFRTTLKLIAKGLNVVFVSRQLGHARPTVTLEVYAHLFERADHAATARAALDANYAALTAGRP